MEYCSFYMSGTGTDCRIFMMHWVICHVVMYAKTWPAISSRQFWAAYVFLKVFSSADILLNIFFALIYVFPEIFSSGRIPFFMTW